MKIGLWIQDSAGNEFLVSKDKNGYPRLISFQGREHFFEEMSSPQDLTLDEGKNLYREVTGKEYPFNHATTRQVIWDLIEASLKLLP
jgi:hypothetical protein